MRRIAALASVTLAGLALVGTSLGKQLHRHTIRAAAVSAQTDQVLEWNQNLLALVQAPGAQPATIHPTRTLAITQLAVYDAVNAIEREAQPYLFDELVPRHASAEAAAASAAHRVLLALLPGQAQAINADFPDLAGTARL
jgi:hypothetical protein